MKALLDAIAADPALEGLKDSDEVIAVPQSARAALLAALLRDRPDHEVTLIVTPSTGAAERLATEMRCLLGASAVEYFPAWEILPFEHVSPTVETVGERARIIWRTRRRSATLIAIVTSIRALLHSIGPGCLVDDPLLIAEGREIELDSLVERLICWGYERTYQVENHGEFAIRGGILDIWPAGKTDPVRIELWGDEIEEVRHFSVADQRTTRRANKQVRLFPCRELLLTPEVIERSRRYSGRKGIWKRFEEGNFFPGMESWLPWVVPSAPNLCDLMPASSAAFLMDPKALTDRALMLRSEEEALALTLLDTWDETLNSEHRLPEDFPRLFTDLDSALGSGAMRQIAVMTAPQKPSTRSPALSPWPVTGSKLAYEVIELAKQGWQVLIGTPDKVSTERLADSFRAEGVVVSTSRKLASLSGNHGPGIFLGELDYEAGFMVRNARIALATMADLRGRSTLTRRTRTARKPSVSEFFADIAPGDYVVHYQHGIGRYAGMITRRLGEVERDYLMVEYHGADRLYVPSDQLDAIRKYAGGERPRLSRLGGSDWARVTRKARGEAAKVAERFVELYRDRITVEGHAFAPDSPWQRELESMFPHALTPDQARALREIKADMESPQPMDRLICGDVGFGKTELAVRAAFKAVQDGMQVAVLVPTTLLAYQHHQTFSERFEPFPVKVEMLSRFVSRRDESRILNALASGEVDVVIGTHRLLQADVQIPKLGLLVIDEEQRFGVGHKEQMKEMRRNVDVLTLTATPIPRTLEMSLAGIRDMSTIATPPDERHAVTTFVGEYDEGAVAAAIRRELLRDGQVFYVHNRVRSIDRALDHVRELAPMARIAAAHGQMSEAQLEKTMLSFYRGEIDVLVTTTIVESGLDIHSVNTLIVERADMLGLAQLYQLRGRVGRGRERAYSYFFYPSQDKLTDEAYERLKTIGEHTDLGSGFAIARKDLEIRGAGNLLGEAQSGHIASVGLDLYCQLVSEAVAEMRGRPLPSKLSVRIELPVDAHIPETYIEQESVRLEAYRRLASALTLEDVDEVRQEWIDRFGPLPGEIERLFQIAGLKAECIRHGITEAVYARHRVRLSPVELKASRQVRLKRISPDAIYKADQSQLLLPLGDGLEMAARLADVLNQLLD